MSVYLKADGLPHVGVPPSTIACLARECPNASARVKGLSCGLRNVPGYL